MPKFSEVIFGKKEKTQQLPLFSPEQQDFMNMILSGSQGGMQSGMDYLTQMLSGDPEAMQDFEAPFMREFQEQTIPGLAERFSSLDAQSSSAFGQALGQAGAGLQENLAALRASLQSQALSQLQGMSQIGLGQQYENILRPQTPGTIDYAAQAAGMGAGAAMGSKFMQ